MCTLRQQEHKGGNWYKAKVHLVIGSVEEEGDIMVLAVRYLISSIAEKTIISNFQEASHSAVFVCV